MAKSKRTYVGRGREIKSSDLEHLIFARVVARRARTLLRKTEERGDDQETPVTLRRSVTEGAAIRGGLSTANNKNRKIQESEIKSFFEKVHQTADFLPAKFLQDGAELVPAVCRMAVTTPDQKRYTGSGFLVAPGLIMTNNHVIENSDWADESLAIFHFQEGRSPVRVALEPERFFLTDKKLDFTIVACDRVRTKDIEPVPLFQNPALITRNERVYIIQHPQGRPKEVVLRNNDVLRLKDTVVQYRADTDGGSSGSPVFNEDWQLVALHHAGWREGSGDDATNEGISMSAIIRFLQGRQAEESGGARGVERILENVRDTSPFLGFFDSERSFEVSVDSFVGSSDYADIGFWNIEHFNNNVAAERIGDVGDVVSRLALDAFGLTEVQTGALDRLVERLERTGDSYGYVYENASGSQDIAILYDRDTTEVEKLDELYTRHASLLKARTPSGKTAFPRNPLFARCTVQESTDDPAVTFVMIVVHLKAYVSDPSSRERRALAAEKLAMIVADIRERLDLPVVIGGDYNELIDSGILSPLTDAPDMLALTTDDAEDGGISYVGARYKSLIDHIVVSSDVRLGRIEDDDAAIVRLDRSVADFVEDASDHVPVVVRLVYRDEPVVGDSAGNENEIVIPEGASRIKLQFD